MGINKVILVGNVGKDPEVQYIREDVPVAKFTLATSETYKDNNGQKVTTTEWHNIVAWRSTAKIVEQYIKKGSQLYIEGKITSRSYEKDGVTRYFTEIVANKIQMLDRKADSGTATGFKKDEQASVKQIEDLPMPVDEPDGVFNEGDDLPF